MEKTEPLGFYFALPRLFLRGPRSERNWLEANLVGGFIHLLVYLGAFRILLLRATPLRQILLCLPLAFLVWVFWLLTIYLNSLLIRLLRAAGLMREMPDRYAQSLLVGIITTFFAWALIGAGSWLRALGILWMTLIALNLLAALFLRRDDAVHSATG